MYSSPSHCGTGGGRPIFAIRLHSEIGQVRLIDRFDQSICVSGDRPLVLGWRSKALALSECHSGSQHFDPVS